MFNDYDDSWIAGASKDELKQVIDEVYDEMCKYKMFSSDYDRLSDLHNKLVNVWLINPGDVLPKHQHSWYLSEDDD